VAYDDAVSAAGPPPAPVPDGPAVPREDQPTGQNDDQPETS